MKGCPGGESRERERERKTPNETTRDEVEEKREEREQENEGKTRDTRYDFQERVLSLKQYKSLKQYCSLSSLWVCHLSFSSLEDLPSSSVEALFSFVRMWFT
jgi:hypothetical protein